MDNTYTKEQIKSAVVSELMKTNKDLGLNHLTEEDYRIIGIIVCAIDSLSPNDNPKQEP